MVTVLSLLNMDAKTFILCIILVFHYCYTVDIDYYTDNKDDSQGEKDDEEKARRIGDELSPDEETKNDSLIGRSKEIFENHSHHNVKDNDNYTYENDNDYEVKPSKIRQFPLMHIFEDYEYEYADDNNASYSEVSDDYYKETTTSTTSTEQNFSNTTSSPKTLSGHQHGKVPIPDPYHFEPAVNKIDIKKISSNTSDIEKQDSPLDYDDDNVWYVPEAYPCWQLPLLFGRLKRREMLSDVFVLKGGLLEDISLESETEEKVTTTRQRPDEDSGNKWCEQGPCYGDHTLCVYPNNTIARICEPTYVVKKLSVYGQGTVVNTINSMRHRVAMGTADVYPRLPTASNMQQVMYDADLARISSRWLRQCLPGPATCSSINDKLVTQLECKKSLQYCCMGKRDVNCSPRDECFVPAVIGCLHAWFLSARRKLRKRDIICGHITRETMNTVQILWANTDKIGCAYGKKSNGEIRVVCNFSPGATFYLKTKYYCGVIPHKDVTDHYEELQNYDITSLEFIASLGIQLNKTNLLTPRSWRKEDITQYVKKSPTPWGVGFLRDRLKTQRTYRGDYNNGTIGAIARLVTRYTFYDESGTRCDSGESIYLSGPPGSECVETGRVFKALCYSYRDPYPGYRLAAILAPLALFSLILYDLFSGVLRQTNF